MKPKYLDKTPINMTQKEYDDIVTSIEKYKKIKASLLSHETEKIFFEENKSNLDSLNIYLRNELDIVNSFINEEQDRLSRANIIAENLEENQADYSSLIHVLVNDGENTYQSVYCFYRASDSLTILNHDVEDINYVTLNSPIGKALYGKTIGDEVVVTLPSQKVIKLVIIELEKNYTR